MLGLTVGVLVLFIGSLVVLGLTGAEIVKPWLLLLAFGFAGLIAWFLFGRGLPQPYGARHFAVMCVIGVVPVLMWALYQFVLYSDGGAAACAGGHIGGGILAAMASTAAPITVGLGYVTNKSMELVPVAEADSGEEKEESDE